MCLLCCLLQPVALPWTEIPLAHPQRSFREGRTPLGGSSSSVPLVGLVFVQYLLIPALTLTGREPGCDFWVSALIVRTVISSSPFFFVHPEMPMMEEPSSLQESVHSETERIIRSDLSKLPAQNYSHEPAGRCGETLVSASHRLSRPRCVYWLPLLPGSRLKHLKRPPICLERMWIQREVSCAMEVSR